MLCPAGLNNPVYNKTLLSTSRRLKKLPGNNLPRGSMKLETYLTANFYLKKVLHQDNSVKPNIISFSCSVKNLFDCFENWPFEEN